MPTCPKGYHQVTKVALSFQQSVVNTSTIKSMLTSSSALPVSGCIGRKGVIAPNTKILNQNLGKKPFSCSFTSFFARMWQVLTNLIYHGSLLYALTQLSCWAANTWPRTEFFQNSRKQSMWSHVPFSQKSIKTFPKWVLTRIHFLSVYYPLPIGLICGEFEAIGGWQIKA